jgi:glutamyl-tRNA synthetase
MNTLRRVRVRFAPSPTGALHIGGIRTALFNYLLAKKNGGDFILRIEDTDQNRFVAGAEQYIIEALSWCGIAPNEGIGAGDGPHAPYRQSERKPMYRQYAERLISSGHAYYAFDTEEELDRWREDMKAQGVPSPQYSASTRQYLQNSTSLSTDETATRIARGDKYVIRFKMPRNEDVKFHDLIRGWVTFNTSQLDDKVLLKHDGMPTYHLAHVVDDTLMEITHAIRGEEWLPSAPLHVLCFRALDLEATMPLYAHLPLILKPDGNGKLSKRDGDKLGFPSFPITWVDPATGDTATGYREHGFFPEALMNFLAFIGWNPGGDKELLSMDELIESFSLEKVHKAGARFDYEKAKWYNQQYLKAKSNEQLAALIKSQMIAAGFNDTEEQLALYCGLVKERCTFLNDLVNAGPFLYREIENYDQDTIKKKWKLEIAHKLEEYLALPTNRELGAEDWTNGFISYTGLKTGEIMPVMRVALAGVLQGPPVIEMAKYLGTVGIINRLKKSFEYFKSIA